MSCDDRERAREEECGGVGGDYAILIMWPILVKCASIPDLHGSDLDSQCGGEENDWKSHSFPSLH